ncbi:MAG: nickel pincer cofactor biosynthesis protein LarB [Prosthecobacter sp.]|jgi:NCAIR mutase (PurE)-related protein|uniref:nickel pincer cofactor biosynthesis protein LarB n=1 Tax=Prosthecobacter sp. TaxID=1965333 RepID=UPI0019EE4891|nr:nickel pincer cofactor biosynthesis protein LarB [Prosthecobacter sp.]MBE2283726.1 nickel pincer cofactor biosynthesis protein LarB [Prosthecobacter sp.]
MNESKLRELLAQVSAGQLPAEQALERLRTLPFVEAGQVLADTHRAIRQGFPETVFAEGKTLTQTTDALTLLVGAHGCALATRVSIEMASLLLQRFPTGSYDGVSRLYRIGQMDRSFQAAPVTVVSAGTSDLPVAEEAAQTLEFAGARVNRINDVGVAGLHRVLARIDELRAASVVIVVAGMEGALPSVVGGLVAAPVIAVPTSVGYGANLHGIAALLGMLNSCASGLTVVNIDNGFGAAMAALRILGTEQPRQALTANGGH